VSNAGQAILTIGGTIVGSFFGNPQLGYLLGSLAGQAFFPTDLGTTKGPRLNDLSVQSSAIGAPIPIVYGTFALAGNVIWSSGLIERVKKKEVGGKGGPTQTVKTYSYSVDLAVGICEGQIQTIRKIWADAKVIYDLSPQGADESDEDFAARMAQTDQTAQIMTIYNGSDTQLPDPTIESYVGVGDTQAYRGLAYVVFDGFQLELFGNRVPNFRFEVVSGPVTNEDCTQYSNELLYPWVSGDDPRNPLNVHEFTIQHYGSVDDQDFYTGPDGATPLSSPNAFLAASSNSLGRDFTAYFGGFTDSVFSTNTSKTPGNTEVAGEKINLYLHWNTKTPTVFKFNDTGLSFCGRVEPGTPGQTILIGLNYSAFGWHVSTSTVQMFLASDTGPEGTADASWDSTVTCHPLNVAAKSSRVIKTTRVTRAPWDTADDYRYTALPGSANYFQEIATGAIVRGVEWTYTTGTFKVLQQYDEAGGLVTKYPLNPCLPSTHPDYGNQAFWEAAYAQAVADGDIAGGLTYGVDYPVVQSWGYVGQCMAQSIDVSCEPVADIVEDLCNRVGLADAQIDVSDIGSCVHGYCVTRPMPARDAIAPLRSFGVFDAVESGLQLKFVERGHASVATLTENDLAAHVSGEERPTVVTVNRAQEPELPRRLNVRYVSPDRNYEISAQSASRISSRSELVSDIDIPIAMSDAEAAALAEIWLYDAWSARNAYQVSVSNRHLPLEPTDCIDVPVDGDSQRMRIISEAYSIGGIKRLECLRDDADIYDATAPGDVPAGSGGGAPIGVVCPTELILIDIPGLREQDRDAGYYAAARGTCDSWTGAEVYRSADGGTSYTWVAETMLEGTIGSVVTPLAGFSSPPENWLDSSLAYDSTSEIEVVLRSGSGLSSVTDAQIENGANVAVVGVHGRWEVIQFKTAVQQTDGNWLLTDLIRGVRGTSAFIGTGEVGDTFVLMNDLAVMRVPETESGIGVTKLIKAPTYGQTLDSAVAQSFTTAGRSFRPTGIAGLDDTDTTGLLDGYILVWNEVTGKWETLPEISLQAGANIEITSPSARVRTIRATGIELVTFTGNLTLDTSHNGKKLYHPSGAGAGDAITLPQDVVPDNFTVNVINLDSNDVAIDVEANSPDDVLYFAGNGATGPRLLTQYGMCVITYLGGGTWMITGINVE
jgi:hypothetical protein